jgi:hypothetical protein
MTAVRGASRLRDGDDHITRWLVGDAEKAARDLDLDALAGAAAGGPRIQGFHADGVLGRAVEGDAFACDPRLDAVGPRHAPGGTVDPEQRAEADVNIEFQSTAKFADQAMKLAFFFRDANEKYAADYPAAVGHHMTNTDSSEFMNLVPAISLRENERGMQIGAGWNPQYHQPTDRYAAYSDKDFRLGLNAAQTTLAAVAQLAGTIVKK